MENLKNRSIFEKENGEFNEGRGEEVRPIESENMLTIYSFIHRMH